MDEREHQTLTAVKERRLELCSKYVGLNASETVPTDEDRNLECTKIHHNINQIYALSSFIFLAIILLFCCLATITLNLSKSDNPLLFFFASNFFAH